jgi:hypothetical protein
MRRIFVLLILFMMFAAQPLLAATYKVSVRNIYVVDSSAEGVCVEKNGRCFVQMRVLEGAEDRKIDVGVALENGFVRLLFKSDGQYLSTVGQGWDSFSLSLSEFLAHPQKVKVFRPHPSIQNDSVALIPLVVRPPNRLLAEVEVKVER